MPRCTWLTSSDGSSTSTTPSPTSSTCVQRSTIARTKLSFADSPRPRMFSAVSSDDHDEPADDVVGVVLERVQPGERAQVVGHEERGDRDREDVVEAQRPAREERDDVVEGVARERGGAARFGEHRGALGVGFRRQREQPAREHEDERREARARGPRRGRARSRSRSRRCRRRSRTSPRRRPSCAAPARRGAP